MSTTTYNSSGVAEAFESWDSQHVKITSAAGGDSLTLKVIITGTNDRATAYAKLIANLSNALDSVGLGRKVVADSIDMRPIGNEIWAADVEYVSPQSSNTAQVPKAVGEVTFEFDGTGGTTTTLYAFAQDRYPPTATDFGNAIEVGEDQKPKGVEIVIPQVRFSLHQAFSGASITLPWLRNVIFLTGTTNIAPFLGFAAGEVLFLGPTGQQPLQFMSDSTVVAGERDVTFQFAVSPNLNSLSFGDVTGVAKAGHQYLWVNSRQSKDPSTGVITDKPVGVYVASVYRPGDFSILGINNPDTSAPVVGA